MDPTRFDRFTRTVGVNSGTRRQALRVLAGSALSAALVGNGPLATTAKKKKRRKRRQLCIRDFNTCNLDGGKACCAGEGKCCPPYDKHLDGGDGEPTCAPADGSCCAATDGGGWCGLDEQCCPLSARYVGVNDYCESIDGECCDDAVGGSCGPGLTCCVDHQASPQYTCCPKPTELSAARATHFARNFRVRRRAPRR
jgi:hypothetical protein